MKLVQLLAKELKEWPENSTWCSQDSDKEIRFEMVDGDFFASELADGHGGVGDGERVTKSQWQAEREKMNKPKWIRHRGGKCPVKAGTKVVTRYRDGLVSDWCMTRNQDTDEECLSAVWSHSGGETDIMAYYVEETKDQEIEEVKKTNFGTITYKLEIDATEATKRIDSLVAKWGQIVSPLKWRDAIIHCQAIIEDCEREIQRNVNLLDAEGLMMQKDSKKAMQHYAPDVDMSDWRNWQAGDVIEIVANEGAHEFENGEEVIVVFLDLNDTDMSVKAKYKDGSDYWWLSGKDAKFIRRP